jgi:hypothetical protein
MQSASPALKGAADNSNFEAVLRGAGEIPATSVYKERASALETSARTDYIKLHADAASNKASVGACDEAKHEAELVLAVDSANKTARWIVGRCAALAKKGAARSPRMHKRPSRRPQPPSRWPLPRPSQAQSSCPSPPHRLPSPNPVRIPTS